MLRQSGYMTMIISIILSLALPLATLLLVISLQPASLESMDGLLQTLRMSRRALHPRRPAKG